MSMEMRDVVEMLERNYKDDTELVVAWWDADWFREQLNDVFGELTDEEVQVCMDAADNAVEWSNLGSSIVHECEAMIESLRGGAKK